MDNVKTSWWQSHRPTTRRLVQLYAALLHNAHLKGFIEGEIYTGSTKYVCTPGFNCYSCPGAAGACPLGSIQNALASTSHRAGWYVLGILLLYGVILGRTICGWICPLGLIQELLHKLPTVKLKKNTFTRALSWLKYLILAVFVVAVPLWYGVAHDLPLPAFCKYICPAGTFEGAMGLLSNPVNASKFSMLGILFTRKFIIMLIIALACIFCYRSFCRFLCPLGAIYGLFNRFNIIGVKVDAERCNHCGACVRNCGMDVRHVGDHECINCAKCMDVCNQKAISLKAGKITLKAPEGGCAGDSADAPEKRRKFSRVAWTVALALLCFALLWYNVLDPSIKKQATASQMPAAAPAQSQQETGGTENIPEEAATQKASDDTGTAEGAADSTGSESADAVPAAAEAQTFESDAPIGNEVGQQLADFTIKCFDGSEFHLADYRGKIVFLNLWATYCAPCVQELPHFDALYQEHEGEVAVLAVHSSMVTDDPVEYVASKGWTMPFAVDTDDDTIWNIVAGSSTMPQTIVLNRKGEVIYNQTRSVTAEMLSALYAQADESVPAAPAGSEVTAAAPAAAAAVQSYESDAPIGNEVGQQLADFTIKCFDGSEFHLADYRGKIVFLNLWATYCAPCVQELPHFNEMYQEHEGEVAVLAIHSSMVTDDPVAYVASKGWEMPFAVDTDDDTIWNIVAGSSTMPQTIVLNRKGEVVYNQTRSVTAEMLDSLYELADQ